MRNLSGIGPRNLALLKKLTGNERVIDLLWHLPSGVIDRRYSPRLATAAGGMVATIVITAKRHQAPSKRGAPYRVLCTDSEGGEIDLIFFNAQPRYLMEELPVGTPRLISGRLDYHHGRLQMVHPDAIAQPEAFDKIAVVEPSYPMTAGLAPKTLRRAVLEAVNLVPSLPDWLPAGLATREQWLPFREAVAAVHGVDDLADGERVDRARARLSYDELLSGQLSLALVRHKQKSLRGRQLRDADALRKKVMSALPFDLTPAQSDALAEVDHDLSAGKRMLRLLQGDVGSGKTIVAFMAMLRAAASGGQSAIMAPTEILARQHAATMAPWAEAAGLSLAVLTGRDKGKARDDILTRLKHGQIDIVTGTHALFQESIDFADLMMIVIDEQHRFGVQQRLAFADKGVAADVLVMTATPIPRTLSLTLYGDMDVSRITGKPPGRKPVDTRAVPKTRLDDVIAGVGRAIERGERVYWVCPLVEETEGGDAVDTRGAAESRAASLRALFGERVGLAHGRLSGPEKDKAIADFSKGTTLILVATTVIEVGVNVPEATIMVIEDAERFGLAQLHQLRGRVGRSDKPAVCLLLYNHPLGEVAKERLNVLRETEDGFRIAEEDLRLRGGGEAMGTRQAGLPSYRVADIERDDRLVEIAHDDARLIVETDPDLTGKRGEALRTLLYLFERDAAVRLLRSG